MTCPKCNSSDVRRSRDTGWKDTLQSLVGRQPFRCRKCRHRYLALPSKRLAANDPNQLCSCNTLPDPIRKKRRMRRLFRRVIAVSVLVVMFSLFGLFLRYISVDHVPKSDAQDMNSPNE